MPRIPIWLSNEEFSELTKFCEKDGRSPYAIIKESLQQRLDKVKEKNESKPNSGTEGRGPQAPKVSY